MNMNIFDDFITEIEDGHRKSFLEMAAQRTPEEQAEWDARWEDYIKNAGVIGYVRG